MKWGIIKKAPSGNTVFVPVCENTFYITEFNRAHSQHHFDGYLTSVRLLGVVLLQNEISSSSEDFLVVMKRGSWNPQMK